GGPKADRASDDHQKQISKEGHRVLLYGDTCQGSRTPRQPHVPGGIPTCTARSARRVSGGWPIEWARISHAPRGIIQDGIRMISGPDQSISFSSYGRSPPVVKLPRQGPSGMQTDRSPPCHSATLW